MARWEETIRGGMEVHWVTPLAASARRSLESEPGKLGLRRVNDNERKNNHSLLRRRQQRRADLLILHSGRTADHQPRYFKRPLAAAPQPLP